MLTTTVKRIADSVLALRSTDEPDGSLCWRALRVASASPGDIRQMEVVLAAPGAGSQMGRADFEAWKSADEHVHGKRVVIFAEVVDENICHARAITRDTPCDVPGVSAEQVRAWWRTTMQCDLVCNSVMATLQSYLLAEKELVVPTPAGNYKLVGVERYACTATIGFSCLTWASAAATVQPDGVRAFVNPDILRGRLGANHTILKLLLATPDGSAYHIWCDPTARQVHPDMELSEDGLHDVKFYHDSTFRAIGKYDDLIEKPPLYVDYMDVLSAERGVHWCLPRVIYNFMQEAESGFLGEAAFDRELTKWKGVMERHTQLEIHWGEAELVAREWYASARPRVARH